MIHYIEPYCSEKKIAKAYNKAVSMLPESDWVCITDQDALFVHPESKAIIERVAESNPPIELFGCMTNRLNVPEQLVPGMFDECDLSKHVEKAKELHGMGYKETKGVIAGLFMLFRVSDWKRVGGFDELPEPFGYKFDTFFSQKFTRKAILTGVYMLHLYRWGAVEPAKEIKHLVP
jgi:GT2 family glycosyltransferase